MSDQWAAVVDLDAVRRERDPTAAERAAREELRRAYHAPGGYLVDCMICGAVDAMAVRPTRRSWPYVQCSACQTQAHLRGLAAQAALVEHSVRVLVARADSAPEAAGGGE